MSHYAFVCLACLKPLNTEHAVCGERCYCRLVEALKRERTSNHTFDMQRHATSVEAR